MINSVIVNFSKSADRLLYNEIMTCFPRLNLSKIAQQSVDGSLLKAINKKEPDLVFIEIQKDISSLKKFFEIRKIIHPEVILISDNRDSIFDTIKYRISGYLLKPIKIESLFSTVNCAIGRIEAGKQRKADQGKVIQLGVIGVPTMEGYEYLSINNIIRCESYLKCTRVITSKRTDIISSYNIGQFLKHLEPFGFFTPHQSYLINLRYVEKFHKEGTIIMKDNSIIPVSRRRKTSFINALPHL